MEINGVTKTVLEYLRNQIIIGKLPGGRKLYEDKLADDLGVSRGPLREAFQVLEQEDLIFRIPRRGSYVKKTSIGDFQQMYQARMMIECYVIELLKTKNIRNLPEVASTLSQTSELRVPSLSDPVEALGFLQVMDEYHIKLVASAGNELLKCFYEIIRSNISRYKYMFIFLPGGAKLYIHEHEQIMNFINLGEYEDAKALLKTHINHSREAIENTVLKTGLVNEGFVSHGQDRDGKANFL